MKIHSIIYWLHIINISCWVINDPRPAPTHIFKNLSQMLGSEFSIIFQNFFTIFIILSARIEDYRSFFQFSPSKLRSQRFQGRFIWSAIILIKSRFLKKGLQSSINKGCRSKMKQVRLRYIHYFFHDIWFKFCLFSINTQKNFTDNRSKLYL